MSWRIFDHVRKRKMFLSRSTLKLRNIRNIWCYCDVNIVHGAQEIWRILEYWRLKRCHIVPTSRQLISPFSWEVAPITQRHGTTFQTNEGLNCNATKASEIARQLPSFTRNALLLQSGESVKEYLLDPDGEGTVIIPNVGHVTSQKTIYIYIYIHTLKALGNRLMRKSESS